MSQRVLTSRHCCYQLYSVARLLQSHQSSASLSSSTRRLSFRLTFDTSVLQIHTDTVLSLITGPLSQFCINRKVSHVITGSSSLGLSTIKDKGCYWVDRYRCLALGFRKVEGKKPTKFFGKTKESTRSYFYAGISRRITEYTKE